MFHSTCCSRERASIAMLWGSDDDNDMPHMIIDFCCGTAKAFSVSRTCRIVLLCRMTVWSRAKKKRAFVEHVTNAYTHARRSLIVKPITSGWGKRTRIILHQVLNTYGDGQLWARRFTFLSAGQAPAALLAGSITLQYINNFITTTYNIDTFQRSVTQLWTWMQFAVLDRCRAMMMALKIFVDESHEKRCSKPTSQREFQFSFNRRSFLASKGMNVQFHGWLKIHGFLFAEL